MDITDKLVLSILARDCIQVWVFFSHLVMAQNQLNSPKGKATPSQTPNSDHLNIDVSESERFNLTDGICTSPTKGNTNSPIQGTKKPIQEQISQIRAGQIFRTLS